MDAIPPVAPPVVTQEIRLVDAQGHVRMLLSTLAGAPSIVLMREDGQPGVSVALKADGLPAITLANPQAAGPTAVLEIDDKGAHVKFDRPGGASSYVFLSNGGTSGLVSLDARGTRRLNAIVNADGSAKVETFGEGGQAVPAAPR